MTDRQSVVGMVKNMARIVKDPDERRTELIAVAQRLFYTKGYERTSINDIVTEVGVAKGTFYYYFDSKTAVLEAMITGMAAQIQAIFHQIVADETLDALSKWKRAMQVAGDWKLERKEELIELIRMQARKENIVLRHKLQEELFPVTVVEYAKIIAQGIDEGVFNTPYVEESAKIVVSIMSGFKDSMTDIFLNPDQLDNPAEFVLQQYAAMQTAVERVLGAAEGSLPIVEDALITAWFASSE
jgi:AcrR family transcriptional regulator